MAVPPELGPEGKALSKGLKAEKELRHGWILKSGEFKPLVENETHSAAASRILGKAATEQDALDRGAVRVHVRDYIPGKPTEVSFLAKENNPRNVAKIQKALHQVPAGTKNVTIEFQNPKSFQEIPYEQALTTFGEKISAKKLDFRAIPGHVEISPAQSRPLPAQPRLPDRGTYAAIQTDDGSIYHDANPEKQRTHIMLANDLGIPPERVVSGGWLTDGAYEGSVRSDAGKWGEQARARVPAAEKRAARSVRYEHREANFSREAGCAGGQSKKCTPQNHNDG